MQTRGDEYVHQAVHHHCNITIQAGSNIVDGALKLVVCQLNIEVRAALPRKLVDPVQPVRLEVLLIRGEYVSDETSTKQAKNTTMTRIKVKQVWAHCRRFDEHGFSESSGTSKTRV